MTEITCLHCGTKPKHRFINGHYWCGKCEKTYSADEIRAHLIERMKETEQRMLQKECVTCGKQLYAPNWCSWCCGEPKSGKDIISEMRDRISVTDAIIAAGEPALFKNARLGDKLAIKSVFEEALIYSEWKFLIGLGTIAVDFLITILKCADEINVKHPDGFRGGGWSRMDSREIRYDTAYALGEIGDIRAVEPLIEALMIAPVGVKSAAAYALGKIGDVHAVEPLIEAITDENFDAEEVDNQAFKALNKIGSPHAFEQLLKKLEGNYRPKWKLEETVQFRVVSTLNTILERAAGEITENELLAASEIKDVPVLILEQGKTEIEGEDAYGRYTLRFDDEVEHMVDCSSLREAAQREMKLRCLTE